MKNTVILLCAGSGKRMNSSIKKQYISLLGKPVIYYSLNTFQNSQVIDNIVLVVGPGEEEFVKTGIIDKYGFTKVSAITTGGTERYDSVAEGLKMVSPDTEYIFIHDGARAFITEEVVSRLLEEVKIYGSAVAAVPCKDTLKQTDREGFVEQTLDRSRIRQIQTPQVFEAELVRKAYDMCIKNRNSLQEKGISITDDASLVEMFTNHRVRLTMGSYDNIKITTPEDLLLGEMIVKKIYN